MMRQPFSDAEREAMRAKAENGLYGEAGALILDLLDENATMRRRIGRQVWLEKPRVQPGKLRAMLEAQR